MLVLPSRSALVKNLKPGQSLTKVTEDTFKAWKKKKVRIFFLDPRPASAARGV